MNALVSVILAVQMLAALGMIGLILIQHGKGADMGAAFGSGSSGSVLETPAAAVPANAPASEAPAAPALIAPVVESGPAAAIPGNVAPVAAPESPATAPAEGATGQIPAK